MDDQCKYTLCFFRDLSQRIGCHEGALKLIISLIAAYPLGVLYNVFVIRFHVQYKHFYFLASGLALGIFNYGFNILHTLTAIVTVFGTIKLLHGNRTSVIIIFIFCTAYLLWGYFKTQSEEYAFEWTIPQCVVTLRLIAVAFDVYDGCQIKKKFSMQRKNPLTEADEVTQVKDTNDVIQHLSSSSPPADDVTSVSGKESDKCHESTFASSSFSQLKKSSESCNGKHSSSCYPDNLSSKESSACSSTVISSEKEVTVGRNVSTTCSSSPPTSSKTSSFHLNEEALLEEPSLLQFLAHCYFPASFLVGPQFGLKQYLEFVHVNDSFLDKSLCPALQRLGLGVIYLTIFQVGSQLFPYQYLVSSEFKDLDFCKKLVLMTVITKIQLCKYICIWLISEGSCIMSGVTFDLKTASFDKCSNVRIKEYETTSTFGGVIHSFNVTTNHWAGKYVFKRLKFLQSKFLSHILTLIYLALWHGWKSGYYVTFTIEFLIMKVEREVLSFISEKRKEDKSLDVFLSRPLVSWMIKIFFRVYTLVVFGYCLIPFLLLTYIKWWDVLKQLYFFGHVIYIPAVILTPILLQQFKPESKRHY